MLAARHDDDDDDTTIWHHLVSKCIVRPALLQ